MLSMDGPNVKELKSLELKNDTAMVRQDVPAAAPKCPKSGGLKMYPF